MMKGSETLSPHIANKNIRVTLHKAYRLKKEQRENAF